LIVDYDTLLGKVNYKPYYICHIRVVQDYIPVSVGELLLRKGDIVLVTVTDTSGWWLGELNGEIGRFPICCCTFLDGTACKDGYEPFNIAACASDGKTPRENKILDAKRLAEMTGNSAGRDTTQTNGKQFAVSPHQTASEGQQEHTSRSKDGADPKDESKDGPEPSGEATNESDDLFAFG